MRAWRGQVFDQGQLRHGIVVQNDEEFALSDTVPDDAEVTDFLGVLCPGFVDLQVNGGDGVLLNDAPSVDTIARMSKAHRATGTAAILPTLITDRPDITRAAIEAAKQAGSEGLHLEGPHLSVARKGAHKAALIRKMTVEDCGALCAAAQDLPALMVTVAPENVTPEQIAQLTKAGVIVSLGHTDCSYETARAAIAAGARCVTHLFNAMSPLTARAPGLVGAALEGGVSAGLIADGIHVHPATIRAALNAKQGPGELFLVSDAMAVTGTDLTEFSLNGRRILRRDGRLTLEDGTLAGADLTMARALQVMVEQVGVSLEKALRMAISVPSSVIKRPDLDRIQGQRQMLHLSPDFRVNWIG